MDIGRRLMPQPDFTLAANGLQTAAENLRLCENLPSIDCGAQLLAMMQTLLERFENLERKYDGLERKFDGLERRMTITSVLRDNVVLRHWNQSAESPADQLAPLFSFQTGEEIDRCPSTVEELESLNAGEVDRLLRHLDETTDGRIDMCYIFMKTHYSRVVAVRQPRRASMHARCSAVIAATGEASFSEALLKLVDNWKFAYQQGHSGDIPRIHRPGGMMNTSYFEAAWTHGKVKATSNARETIDYGTNVVGGVSPGKGGGTHLGLPVFSTVREAMDKTQPDASAVFVPAEFAAKAIMESIEAEVPLVVSVAEHIPVHDLMRVHEMLRTQQKTRLVGPNCPGVIAPEQCRLGIMPFKQYRRGSVGIVSKSGTLSYEAVGATTAAGLGQSLVIAIGGDSMPGTSMVDALHVLFRDEETEGVIVIGEIGGNEEMRAAELIREYRRTAQKPKPVIALVAGQTAPRERTMGHAGARLSSRDSTAGEKTEALRRAGAVVVENPGVMGARMKELLGR
ncbi:hypothetical protein CP532_2581 [Ophiocordyceps camponoti-leonardi (nom. inval.)]|nr:hypothetical protein CP532_2581 [Ophiocordyceps camponoti-leonardi (nom. inval.)]